MSAISTLILVQLDGEVPPRLNLPLLRTLAASCNSVLSTLSPYLQESGSVIQVTNREELAAIPPAVGKIVLYVVGHAWMDGQQLWTGVRTRGGSELLSGHELAELLLAPVPKSSDLVLLVDT